jgi:hypothetical protein
MDQKLSEVEMPMIFSSGRPAILRHSARASSSSEKTVTRSLSLGRANSFVTSSQAWLIARSLK